jgi:carboxyl-terminal processing protease
VVDLRGNPGGLLDEAVEMASYLLPARSGVVSSRGKDGTEFVYKSVIDPIRGPAMKLVVLVNGGSASAAEIVAGAVQDTDSGVIVGPSKTFGKGLVQKIVPLPFDNALKFTVAKYYTPSGRCIQAINYRGGRGDAGLTASSQRSNGEEGFVEGLEESEATAVSEDQRKTFYTAKGRSVRDGGGIEPDFLVPELKAGPAESVFLTRGVYFDFISEYVKTHDSLAPLKELVMRDRRTRYDDTRIIGGASAQSLVLDSFPRIKAEDRLFDEFRRYVSSRVAAGTLSVTDAFNKPLADLEKSLASTGLQDATSGVEAVKQRIAASIMRDLDSHRSVISNDLELSLLSRELPDRLLLQKSVLQDAQVAAAVELIADEPKYAVLLRASEVVPGSGPSDGDKAFRLAGAH